MDRIKDTKYIQPFTTKYSRQVPELLNSLGCSIVLSTYQAGKVIFISSNDGKLVQLTRTFPKPMGIALSEDGERMALANLSEVVVFQNNSSLAHHYPRKPKVYDAMYLPRATYHTNPLDIHDLVWVNKELYAVNTMFSCIVKIDDRFSFTPVWQPSFISKIVSEDRCHLNGMVTINDTLKYATAFSQSDSPRGWRKDLMHTGVLINIESNKIVLDNLAMPHSPRWFNEHVYIALSGEGKIIRYNPITNKREEVIQLKGFLRGMAFLENYLFVAHSKVRKESSSFGQLNLEGAKLNAGIYIVDIVNNSLIGHIEYLNSVEEIYDLQIISKFRRPNILQPTDKEQLLGLSTPNATYWGQKHRHDEKKST